jgi:transcriptional regulator with XRE-family HTH domain
MSFNKKLSAKFEEYKKNKTNTIKTQKDFADFLDISTRTLQKYMDGTSMPDLKKAISICDKLNTSLDYMFLDIDEGTEDEEIFKLLRNLFTRDDKDVLKYAKVFMDFLNIKNKKICKN